MPRGPESRTPGVSLPKAKMREALGRRRECTSRAHLRLQDLSRALQSCAQALQKELDPRPLSRPPRPSWGLRRCVSATAHPSKHQGPMSQQSAPDTTPTIFSADHQAWFLEYSRIFWQVRGGERVCNIQKKVLLSNFQK